MAQRVGIAAAVLGDPAVVILDEPVNGLDPYLPTTAGEAILQTGSAEGSLPPWSGLGVYAAYAAAALGAAAVAVTRRDA